MKTMDLASAVYISSQYIHCRVQVLFSHLFYFLVFLNSRKIFFSKTTGMSSPTLLFYPTVNVSYVL